MNPASMFCQIIAGVVARHPGIAFRAIKDRFPTVPSKKFRLAVRALVVAEQIRPETVDGITYFFPKGAA